MQQKFTPFGNIKKFGQLAKYSSTSATAGIFPSESPM
jgi:hypothetical protein